MDNNQLKIKQQKKLDEAKQRRINYGVVFNTHQGQAVLIDIITMCHILEPAPSVDPQTLAHTEGMRRVGLEILKILNVSPKNYIQIVESSTTD